MRAPYTGRDVKADGESEAGEITLRIGGFVRDLIEVEALQLGVSAEELVRFSVLYYLADLDSGRVARDIRALKGLA
jgi:hypothetical protein